MAKRRKPAPKRVVVQKSTLLSAFSKVLAKLNLNQIILALIALGGGYVSYNVNSKQDSIIQKADSTTLKQDTANKRTMAWRSKQDTINAKIDTLLARQLKI